MTVREPNRGSHPSGEPLRVRVERRGETGGGYRVAAREERFAELTLERHGATRTITSTWMAVALFLGGLALLGMGGESMRISGWSLVALALVAGPLVWNSPPRWVDDPGRPASIAALGPIYRYSLSPSVE